MILLAGFLSAAFVYLAVGFLTGHGPRIEFNTRRKASVSDGQLWLTQAGVDLTPRQFWLASFGVGFLAFLVFLLVTGIPSVAAAPALGVVMLPRSYFARRRAMRLSEVQASWPDGLRDLNASISSGMSLQRAVETLAEKGPEPLRAAFGRFSLLARTVGVIPALEIVKEELSDPTSDRVIEVIILAQDRGGNIVPEILQDLAAATTRDLWTLEEIRTESLEQKINARIVFALPWMVLVALTASEGTFRNFYQSGPGTLVVIVGGALSLLGVWLVTRLGREPDEQRVLGGSAVILERQP